jgi:hypothetical protein
VDFAGPAALNETICGSDLEADLVDRDDPC